MNAPPAPAVRLQVGGAVVPDQAVYITRPEDEELCRLLREHEYVNLVSSRQVGKSSLMVRAALRLGAEGWRFAILDLTILGTPNDTEAYFQGLIKALAAGLRLTLDVPAFWSAAAGDTPSQRLIRFFREVVLARIEGPVAVFLDEIDSTLKLPFTDDLFMALRAIYNERTLIEDYRRLSFCLIGVATPNELIKDRRTTPYNIGRTIWVGDFDPARDDLASLVAALHADPAVAQPLLARILYWTGGHPFLTLRLAKELREAGATEPSAVDHFVEHSYASVERLGQDDHVESVLRFMTKRLTDGGATFRLYERLLAGARPPDQPTITHAELKLSGLVKRDPEGRLIVRNRLYGRLFDRRWLHASRPLHATQRYRRLSIAASLALLLAVGGGTAYYTFALRPKVEALQTAVSAREELERLNVRLGQDEPGSLTVDLPGKASQAMLTQAITLLGELTKEPKAVFLDVSDTLVSDLSPLTGLTGLRELDISGTSVSDLSPLAGLTGLQLLYIWNTSVSDLSPLAGLIGLQRLNVSDTPVSDLSPLVGLTGLRELYAWNTPVSDSDLSPLARVAGLRELDISRTPVSDLSPLAGLTGLQGLNVSRTLVSDLSPLVGLTGLQRLIISGTPVSELAPLAGLEKLVWLDITDTNVMELAPVAGKPGLKVVGPGSTRSPQQRQQPQPSDGG